MMVNPDNLRVMITGANTILGAETIQHLLSLKDQTVSIKALVHIHHPNRHPQEEEEEDEDDEGEGNEEGEERDVLRRFGERIQRVMVPDGQRLSPQLFAGIDSLFIIPPRLQKRSLLIHDILQCAQLAGVKFILTVGHLSASHPPSTIMGSMCRETELKVGATGIPHCFLHLEIPMELHLADAANLRKTGAFYYPLHPSSLVNPVLAADVGEIAASVLAHWGSHAGKTYTLTGPGPLSMEDVARVYTEVLGRPITFVPASHRNAILSFQGRGHQEWFAKAIVEVMERMNSPQYVPFTSPDGPTLLHREMSSFHDFVVAHQAHFSK